MSTEESERENIDSALRKSFQEQLDAIRGELAELKRFVKFTDRKPPPSPGTIH